MFCWTVASFNYYMIVFHLGKLEGSLYINGVAIAAAELFGNFIIGELLVQFGLKYTMLASFSVMAFSALLILFPLTTFSLWYAMATFLMKLANTCAFASVFYGTNSLFKIDLVAVIFAVCNMFARFFTIFAPLAAICTTDTVMKVYLSLSLFAILCTAFIADKPKDGSPKKKKKNRNESY